MTCATCKGTGFVQAGVMCPNSRCQKKPLAECRPSAYEGSHDLFVAGRFMASEPIGDLLGDGPVLPSLAAHINAAVDAREAKLRATCMLAAETVARTAYEYHNRPDVEQRDGYGDGARSIALHIAQRIRALEPNAADYVSAAEHAALKAHVSGVWGALLAHLAETEQSTPLALALAAELGVKLEPTVIRNGGQLLLQHGTRTLHLTISEIASTEGPHGTVAVTFLGNGHAVTLPKQPDGTIEGEVVGGAAAVAEAFDSSPIQFPEDIPVLRNLYPELGNRSDDEVETLWATFSDEEYAAQWLHPERRETFVRWLTGRTPAAPRRLIGVQNVTD